MPIARKKTARKALKKRNTTVIVIESEIAAEDTLFPEKVANAKKVLSKAKNHDPRFGPIDLD